MLGTTRSRRRNVPISLCCRLRRPLYLSWESRKFKNFLTVSWTILVVLISKQISVFLRVSISTKKYESITSLNV